jgi:hypothetical protein
MRASFSFQGSNQINIASVKRIFALRSVGFKMLAIRRRLKLTLTKIEIV